ncbi:MAG: DNA internalization-related competence protein ComEC/Rec2 [Polyangiaceae bacterium]|nr:DNA internalization-related competence protein ComEC/Rec2 [Polyangiaceae bacterium]
MAAARERDAKATGKPEVIALARGLPWHYRMTDKVLLIALALTAGSALARAPVPASIAAIVSLFLLRRHVERWALVMLAIALGIGALRSRLAIDAATALHARVVETLGAPGRCEGEAVVIRSPVVQHGEDKRDGSAAGDARIELEIVRGACERGPLVEPLRVRLHGAPDDLARGDRVTVLVDVAPVHLFLNESLPDPRPFIARSGVAASGAVVDLVRVERGTGITAWIDRARVHVRRRIEATFHPEANPLARALVLGETDLRDADDEAFRRSGLSHLLAVSGTHLVLAVAGVAAALRALLVRIEVLAARYDVGRFSAAFAIPTSWLYADFAGGSGSALRAAGMLSAAMLIRTLALRPNGVRAFGVSLFVAVVIDPLVGSDPSFVLSAAATAGLLGLDRPIARFIVRGPAPLQLVLRPIATTLAAMIGCTPFLAMITPNISVLGILANLVAGPIGELAALPVCLAHTVLAWLPPVEQGAAVIGGGALLFVRAVARVTSDLGGVVTFPPPTPAHLATIAVTALAMGLASGKLRRAAALATGLAMLLLVEVLAMRASAVPGKLRVRALDVGQGDSLLVDLPNGMTMLVDGGGFMGSPVDTGTRVVLPVLRAMRRDRVDIVVLSHPHPDHFGGLASTLPSIEVGEFWDTGQGEEHGAGPVYKRMMADLRTRNVRIRKPDELCGKHVLGGATIEVLSPCPGFVPDESANDNSFVLRITYGRRAVLLVGDAEAEAERTLLARNPAVLRADLLKIGHHGSRTSTTPAFLEAVSPSAALVCSGVRNRYGHPDPGVLQRLEARGVAALRTDRGGDIVWETDGERVRMLRPSAR